MHKQEQHFVKHLQEQREKTMEELRNKERELEKLKTQTREKERKEQEINVWVYQELIRMKVGIANDKQQTWVDWAADGIGSAVVSVVTAPLQVVGAVYNRATAGSKTREK